MSVENSSWKKALFFGLGLYSLSAHSADIKISDMHARAVPEVMTTSAAFMTLTNEGKEKVSLVSADSDAAVKAEIHGHTMKDDAMKMFKMDSLPLEPGADVKLESGGYHIMLMGLKRPLPAGEKVNLTLHFSDGDAIDVSVPVREAGAMMSEHKMHQSIELLDASVRATKPGMSTSAAYMSIRNGSKETIRLSGVESPVARKSELHTTIMKDGVMRMRHVEDFQIKPGETAELKPGGYHVMLMGLKEGIKTGDKVPVTLSFNNNQKVTVEAMAMDEIKGQDKAKGHSHSHDHH